MRRGRKAMLKNKPGRGVPSARQHTNRPLSVGGSKSDMELMESEV